MIFTGRNKDIRFFVETDQNLEKQCCLLICKNDFDEIDEKDFDHCQYSGELLGWARPQCNRLRRTSKFIHVIGHNIQNYDLHHICLALQECEPSTTISVIPATDEKYISMQLGVQVDTMKRNGPFVPEFLRFVDTYKFFNASLENSLNFYCNLSLTIWK